MPYRKAVLENTESRIIRSRHTGRKYQLSIGLPYEYETDPRKRWPAVYVLDGNFYFGLATEMVRSMAMCGGSRDALVIGIGYPNQAKGIAGWRQVMAWRSKDLTPTRDEFRETQDAKRLGKRVQTGGGPNFFAFLETELPERAG